jgi:hypothetical protein
LDADVSFSTPPVVGSGVTKTRVEGCTIVVVTAMVLSFFGGSLMHGPMMYDVRQNSEDFLSQFPGKEREKNWFPRLGSRGENNMHEFNTKNKM